MDRSPTGMWAHCGESLPLDGRDVPAGSAEGVRLFRKRQWAEPPLLHARWAQLYSQIDVFAGPIARNPLPYGVAPQNHTFHHHDSRLGADAGACHCAARLGGLEAAVVRKLVGIYGLTTSHVFMDVQELRDDGMSPLNLFAVRGLDVHCRFGVSGWRSYRSLRHGCYREPANHADVAGSFGLRLPVVHSWPTGRRDVVDWDSALGVGGERLVAAVLFLPRWEAWVPLEEGAWCRVADAALCVYIAFAVQRTETAVA